MTKQEFLAALRGGLHGLPQSDVDERVGFYAEMIDDRVEDGLSEEEAVAAIGSADDVAAQIIADTSIGKLVREKIKPRRRLSVFEITLIALGFPIWFSLLIAVVAVVFSLYVTLWAVIVSLWSVFIALVGSALGCAVGGILFLCMGKTFSGLATIAAALVCAGLSIFAFYGCKAATKDTVLLTKKIGFVIKKACMRKGEAQ